MAPRPRCDTQMCLVCLDVLHFTELAAAGLCRECAPVATVIVVSIDAPVPNLRSFDEVDEALEPTLVLPRRDESMWEIVEARA